MLPMFGQSLTISDFFHLHQKKSHLIQQRQSKMYKQDVCNTIENEIQWIVPKKMQSMHECQRMRKREREIGRGRWFDTVHDDTLHLCERIGRYLSKVSPPSQRRREVQHDFSIFGMLTFTRKGRKSETNVASVVLEEHIRLPKKHPEIKL